MTLRKFIHLVTVAAVTATLNTGAPAKAAIFDDRLLPECGEMYWPPICQDETILVPDIDVIAHKQWIDPVNPPVYLVQARSKGSPNPNTHGAGGIRRDPPREIRRPDGPQRMTFD